MSLSDLLKKGGLAKVANAKAANPANTTNQLLAEEETAIRGWLAYIEETDLATITELITRCKSNPVARAYYLERSRELPGPLPADPPDYTANCGACRHFERIDHPNLGHCAKFEPEAIAGLWDSDQRWCTKYEVIEHG